MMDVLYYIYMNTEYMFYVNPLLEIMTNSSQNIQCFKYNLNVLKFILLKAKPYYK